VTDKNPREHRLCLARLDERRIGIPVSLVREVIRPVHLTAVPLAPPEVLGLFNLRSVIVTLLDLRCAMGLRPKADSEQEYVLVIDLDGALSAILVDRVEEVLELKAESFREQKSFGEELGPKVVEGVYEHPEGAILRIDIPTLQKFIRRQSKRIRSQSDSGLIPMPTSEYRMR
jgi:purine-binding chemotaxis protein CheW